MPAAVNVALDKELEVTPLGNHVYVKFALGVTVGVIVTSVFVQVIVPLFTPDDKVIVGVVLSKTTFTTFDAIPVAQPLTVFVTTTL